MKLQQYSVDGGQNWLNMQEIRILFRDADEDDDTLQDLYITATSEGIILDVISQASGLCEKTAFFDVESLCDICE